MSNNFWGWVLAIPIVLAIIGVITIFEMWLVGVVLGVFGLEITRLQSFAIVMLLSLIGGSGRAAATTKKYR